MPKIRDFEDLIAWQRARQLAVLIHSVTERGRFARNFGLRNQIQRAATSVMSNIAEGFGRYGAADMNRFLSISLGSCAEVRSQLVLAADLKYLDEEQRMELSNLCREVERLLYGLRSSLKKKALQRDPRS
jgi:four helix bundle protein